MSGERPSAPIRPSRSTEIAYVNSFAVVAIVRSEARCRPIAYLGCAADDPAQAPERGGVLYAYLRRLRADGTHRLGGAPATAVPDERLRRSTETPLRGSHRRPRAGRRRRSRVALRAGERHAFGTIPRQTRMPRPRNVPRGDSAPPEGGSVSHWWDTAPSDVPDVLAPDLDVVFVGINPGRVSAAARAHFANPRNDFWRLLHASGITSRLYGPEEQFELLREGVGVTNAAYRTTPGSGDLRRGDFSGSAERLERIAHELRPRWLAFVVKEAYRGSFGVRAELGVQQRVLGETRLFVLPSTSPANAAVPWDERLRWFQRLAVAVWR